MIFVAAPYGNPDLMIVETRVFYIMEYCSKLLAEGKSCISAVVFGHPIIKLNNNVRVDWQDWKELCTTLIISSTQLHVLMLDGWENSIGVKEEIKLAEQLKIKVLYIKQEDI